ncbi:hypothetical protein N665_0100s0026, partial [Sinapis alba]
MRILHWNCQRVEKKHHKPDILLLIETKNVDSYVRKIVKEQGYKHSFVISAVGISGGLVIMWDDAVKIHFLGNPTLTNTNMYIDDVTNVFCLTYIYGNPILKYRQSHWERLIRNTAVGLYHSKPRLMLGDFNDIKDNTGKEG